REQRVKRIDALQVGKITAGQIEAFRRDILAGAQTEVERGRARTTFNGYIRNASQLFAPRAMRCYEDVGLRIQTNPFGEVDHEEEPRHFYESSGDMDTVVANATKELQEDEPDAYAAFVLAAYAGLTKSEMDKLMWQQVDFENGVVIIKLTQFY